MLLGCLVVQFGVVWMNTHRRIDILILFRDSHGPSEIIRTRITRPDIQHRRNARVPRTLYDLVTVGIKLLAPTPN